MPANKPIDAFSENDLRALIATNARDPRLFEIKRVLPRPTDAGRLEFLSDAVSFANARGGHIIYDVSTRKKGEPIELNGVDWGDALAVAGFLEQAAADISPRIPGLMIRPVKLQDGRGVVVIRVPQTWAGPHMVVFRDVNKFYSRNATGKFLLDVEGLRAAFTLGDSARDKMRAFQLDRINAILTGNLSVPLPEAPRTVLHVLPLCSFQPGYRIDLGRLTGLDPASVQPMAAGGANSHYNFEGVITYSAHNNAAYSYTQVFRNGCLEATDSLIEARDGRKYLPNVDFEKEIIGCGERLLGLLRRLEIHPPYAIMLSFLGVRGYSMFVGSMRWQSNARQIERDNLYLDEVILDDPAQSFSRVIRPALDQIWNACGWPKSLNYDEAGNWRENSR